MPSFSNGASKGSERARGQTRTRVGVLALQGDFEAHAARLSELGAEPAYVRSAGALADVGGLILPGGESSTMLKLLVGEGLWEPLKDYARDHPTLGTCAGSILMAADVTSPSQDSLKLIDITVERNGYGRQLDSSIRRARPMAELAAGAEQGEFEAVFIRAPRIRRVGEAVTVLAEVDNEPILVQQGDCMAATFHPELTADRRVHRLFLEKVRRSLART